MPFCCLRAENGVVVNTEEKQMNEEINEELEQAKRDFNNLLESRRSVVDFLVEYEEPFYDGSED